MPRGTFQTKTAYTTPATSPLYPDTRIEFSDVEALRVPYYTSAEAIKHLIPEELDLEDKPLVTCSLLSWGYSQFGSYTEFISMVEVSFRGVKYDFASELVLQNEGAIFMGREQLGVPKVIGKVVFDPTSTQTSPGFEAGHVERPVGNKIIQFNFKPEKKVHGLQALSTTAHHKAILALRTIPNVSAGGSPSVREFVVIKTAWPEAEIWSGKGSVTFSNQSELDIAHKFPVLRYEEATLFRKASHYISGELETFPIGRAS